MNDKPKIAVVSPFLDRRHGTERCVVEEIERLVQDYEIHIYSSHIEDLDVAKFVWHRIPSFPAPHLIHYIWFFVANHLARWWDRQIRGIRFDLLFSPGINCFDADVIAVHIVFAEYCRALRQDLQFSANPVTFWPRLLHRRLLYGLLMWLERRVYRDGDAKLIAISAKVAEDLSRFYSRDDATVIYHGLTSSSFDPAICQERRESARRALALPEEAFVLLLVANDWKRKGLPCLLESLARLRNNKIVLAVRGSDEAATLEALVDQRGLRGQVYLFPVPAPDAILYYAAADVCVAPSLEDSFSLPPGEAMACGLPVIASRQAGVSEIIHHGEDGLILEDPRDPQMLAGLIEQLYTDSELRNRLSVHAAATASQYSWDRNAAELKAAFETLIEQQGRLRAGEQTPLSASL